MGTGLHVHMFILFLATRHNNRGLYVASTRACMYVQPTHAMLLGYVVYKHYSTIPVIPAIFLFLTSDWSISLFMYLSLATGI